MLNLPLINSDALACSYPSAICYSGNGRVTVTLSSSWLSVVRPLQMFQKYQEFTTEYHFTSVTTVNEKRPTLKSPRPQLTRSMRKVSKVPPNRVAPLRCTAWTERFPLLHAWTTTNIPASRRYTGQPRVVAAIISLLPRTCSVNGHINARTHTSPAALPKPAGAGFKQKSPFPSNRNGIYIYIHLYIFIYFKAATKCTFAYLYLTISVNVTKVTPQSHLCWWHFPPVSEWPPSCTRCVFVLWWAGLGLHGGLHCGVFPSPKGGKSWVPNVWAAWLNCDFHRPLAKSALASLSFIKQKCLEWLQIQGSPYSLHALISKGAPYPTRCCHSC